MLILREWLVLVILLLKELCPWKATKAPAVNKEMWRWTNVHLGTEMLV